MSKLVNSKKLSLERCIICQNINDIRGGKKLQVLILGEEM